jgi:hypothetical protein
MEATVRTFLLALDAVPFRVAREAAGRGAFAGWSGPSALVAPFPSLTHPAFAALFEPFGVAPSWGYEVRYFDVRANRMTGGNLLTYRNEVPPWYEVLDQPHRGVVAKVANYVSSPWAASAEFDAIAARVIASPRDVVVSYLGATDGYLHLYDDEGPVTFLIDLDRRIADLQQRHLEARGVGLKVVLFSDHGCGRERVHYTGSLTPLLRQAGLRVVDHLDGPTDVVAPTFGIVNYSALHLQDERLADRAASAVAAHQAVELAAYSPEPGLVEVVSDGGRSRVRWRDSEAGVHYRYEDDGQDLLRLEGVRAALAAEGLLDGDGYAHEGEWLRLSAFGAYPDPLRRLARALRGDRVASRATVLMSLGPGWSWGLRSAFAGGLVRGGRLRGTHGGLDRESSLGFLLVDDPDGPVPEAIWADRALAPFAHDLRADRQGVSGRP